jgi:hypothetical protein
VLDSNALPAPSPLSIGAPSAGSPSESPLPAGATTALRCWLQAQRRRHAAGAELRAADIRRALRPVCDEARQRGARVEQVIVLLKELWASLPPDEAVDGRGRGYTDTRREVLDGVVRVCIEEFYAAPDGDAVDWPVTGEHLEGRRPADAVTTPAPRAAPGPPSAPRE